MRALRVAVIGAVLFAIATPAAADDVGNAENNLSQEGVIYPGLHVEGSPASRGRPAAAGKAVGYVVQVPHVVTQSGESCIGTTLRTYPDQASAAAADAAQEQRWLGLVGAG